MAVLGVFAALAVTVGALVLGLQLLRRWTVRMPGGRQRVPIQLLQRSSIGAQQAVGLLRVGERVLVVSMVENGVHLLTELGGEDRARALIAPEPPATRALAPVSRLLRSVGMTAMVAVLMLPTTASAQSTEDGTGTSLSVTTTSGGLPEFELRLGDTASGLKLSGTVGIVVFMSVLTLLPALFLVMTSFTRILIVLHFVRTAIGTPSAPPGQLLVIIAIIMTGTVMAPVLEDANQWALQPYLRGELPQAQAYSRALQPFRQFMLANTNPNELDLFLRLGNSAAIGTADDIPTLTLMSSFVASELKTAFQMGFVIFLPFIVVDLIVAAVLMSMGMFMLPPVMVSLPFKLMLFVLADGWVLVIESLVTSFRV